MSFFEQNRSFFNNPICLSPDEMSNPVIVFDDFFTDYNLSELRQILANIDEACLTSDCSVFEEAWKRADYICFQKKLILVFEAAYILAKQISVP